MWILKLYKNKLKKRKEKAGRIALCSHPPLSHFLFMKKIWQKKLVSIKYVRDKCKLVGCSKTQGNEPWTQNPQTTPILRKDLEKKRTTTLTFIIFEEQNTFLGNKNNSFFVKGVSRKHFLFEDLDLF